MRILHTGEDVAWFSPECNFLYFKLEYIQLNSTKTICDGAYKNVSYW